MGPQWEKTPGSADWPSTRNPLKDFDAGFVGAAKGFPRTTGTADWPSARNPLKDFDMGFKAKWGGYKVGRDARSPPSIIRSTHRLSQPVRDTQTHTCSRE